MEIRRLNHVNVLQLLHYDTEKRYSRNPGNLNHLMSKGGGGERTWMFDLNFVAFPNLSPSSEENAKIYLCHTTTR